MTSILKMRGRQNINVIRDLSINSFFFYSNSHSEKPPFIVRTEERKFISSQSEKKERKDCRSIHRLK